jgi:hypothetical protein
MKRIVFSALMALTCISQVHGYEWENLSYEYIPTKTSQSSMINQVGKMVFETIKKYPKTAALIGAGLAVGYFVNRATKKAQEEYLRDVENYFKDLLGITEQLSKPFIIEDDRIIYLSDEEFKKSQKEKSI